MLNKFFSPRVMVTARDTIPNTSLLFTEMSTNFHFKPESDESYACVMPYVVIIDGQDVLASLTPDGNWSIGFMGMVEKPSWWVRKGKESFDAILGKAVSRIFFDTYETSLTNKDFSILCSSRAVYSLDSRVALPICWLIIPNDRPVGLVSKKGDQIAPLDIKECFEGGMAIQSKHYLTSLVGQLVAAQDIDLPVFSYKSSMHPDL